MILLKPSFRISNAAARVLFTFFVFTFSYKLSYAVTYTWTGTTSTAWATTTNWSPNGNPGSAAGDIVEIGVTSFGGNQPTLSVTPANALASITLGTATNATLTISANYSTGVLFINAGSTVTETGAFTATFSDNFTNNGTYTASSGTHTFSGTSKFITGITSTTISAVTVSGTVSLTGDLTVSGGLAGAGTLTNNSFSTLNLTGGTCNITTLTNQGTLSVSGATILSTALANLTNTDTIDLNTTGTIAGITNNAGGIVNLINTGTITSFNNATSTSILDISDLTVPTITTLTMTAAGNTVIYSGLGGQTGKVGTYRNLTLSGSGTKTFSTTPTVNDTLSMEGTATITVTTGVVTYGASAKLKYNTGTSRTTSTEEFITPFVATGGVVIDNTGTITADAAKQFGNNTNVALTIRTGASFSPNGNTITFHGDFINTGTLVSSAGGITLAGTTATQSIAGFTITGTVSMTKTSGTATFTGNVSGNGFTINGTGGTLNLGTTLIHTFTTWTRTAGTLNGGSSTLNLNGNVSGTGGTFTVSTSKVVYNLLGAQTCAAITYFKLTVAGSGIKTFSTTPTVNDTLAMMGSATITVTTGVVTYGANATLLYNTGTSRTVSSEEWITPFAAAGGVVIDSTGTITINGAKTFGASTNRPLTIRSGATLSTGANLGLTFHGNFVNNGTLSAGSSTITITGSATPQSIDGFTTTGAVSYSKTGAHTTTINGDIIAASFSTTTALNGASVINFSSGASITTSGNITWGRPTTGGTLTINQNAESLSCVVMALQATTGVRTVILNISTGTITATSNITASGVSSSIVSSGASTINVAGSFMSGGTFTCGTASTVNLTGAAQTVLVATYFNLNVQGSNTKTFSTTPTINGKLSMEGTATITVTTGVVTYGASATLQYNTSTGRTSSSEEWITPFNGSGGVIIDNTGTITLDAAKVLNQPLLIDAGSTLSLSTFTLSSPTSLTINTIGGGTGGTISGTGILTVGGNVTINYTGSGAISAGATISCPLELGAANRTVTVNDDGTTTNSDLSITGVVSSTGAFGLIKEGDGGLTLSNTNTNTGGFTLNNGLVFINSVQALGTVAGTFTITGGTINNSSGSLVSTLNYPLAINGSFTFVGTDALHLGTGSTSMNGDYALTISASTLTIGGTINQSTRSLTKLGGGTLSFGSNAVTLASITLSTGTLISTSNTLSLAGDFTNNATYTHNSGTVSFDGGTQAIGGSSATTFDDLTMGAAGTKTMGNNITVSGVMAFTAGVLAIASNTLTLNGTVTTTSGTLSAGSCGAATSNLTIGGSGALGTFGLTSGARTFNNITLNRTSGSATISTPVNIGGTLTLTDGALVIENRIAFHTSNLPISRTSGTITMNLATTLVFGNCDQAGTAFTLPNNLFTAAPSLTQLIIDRTNGVTLGNQIVTVTGALTITNNATLTTAGNLTLASTVSGDAFVEALSGAASISGNVKVERFIPSSGRRWRFMSSPVTSALLSDWQGEIFITGVGGSANGFDNTASNFAGVYGYNEPETGNLDQGWLAPSSNTMPLVVGKGYRVFVRGDRSNSGVLDGSVSTQAAVTINTIGTLNIGNVTMPVSYTANNGLADDGWNLVGNPYASAFNWDAFHDAGRLGNSPDFTGTDYAHLDATAYIFDANANSYVLFNATSTGTGSFSSGLVPSGASFFVKAGSTTLIPNMVVKETYKSTSQPGSMFKKGANDYFRIKMVLNNLNTDEMVLAYQDEASVDLDNFDAAKFYGPEVNLASISKDGKFLSVNFKPFNGQSDTVFLSVGVRTAGHYRFDFSNVDKLINDGSKSIGLFDFFTKRIMDLRQIKAYEFDADPANAASFGNQRFAVVIGHFTGLETPTSPEGFAKLRVYPLVTNDLLQIRSSYQIEGKLELKIIDITGKVCLEKSDLTWSNNSVQVDLSALSSGSYFIQVVSKEFQQPVMLRCIKE